jgi:hypothetical protein
LILPHGYVPCSQVIFNVIIRKMPMPFGLITGIKLTQLKLVERFKASDYHLPETNSPDSKRSDDPEA